MHRKRYLTSAPALTVLAVCTVVTTIWMETEIRESKSLVSAIQIVSDDGEEFEISDNSELPESTKSNLNAFVGSSVLGEISITRIEQLPDYIQADAEDQLAMRAYVGRILAAKNRFNEAVAVLNSLSGEQRQRFETTFAFAETLKGLGEQAAALQAYEAHISQNPNHQAGLINYAIFLANLDMHEEAMGVLHKAINVTSGDRKGKSYSLLGIQQTRLAAFEDAVTSFRRSLQFRPGHGPTWRRLAAAQSKLSTFSQQEVISTFQKSDAVAPGDAGTKGDFAAYYFSVGRFDEALPYYRDASKLAPEKVTLLIRRTQNLISSERPSAARQVLKKIKVQKLSAKDLKRFRILDAVLNGNQTKVLKLLDTETFVNETDSDRFNLLLAFLDVGDYEKASALTTQFKERSTYHQPAKFLIARGFYRAGRNDDALTLFNSLVSKNSESPAFWLYLGRANTKQGDLEEALRANELAYNLYPDSGRITIEYSKSLGAIGDTSSAAEVLFTYLESKPKDARALTALAEYYVGVNNYDRAEQLFKIVQDLQPDNLRIAKNLANVQILGERPNAAIRSLDAIIGQEPSDTEARLLRASALEQTGQKSAAILEYEIILKLDVDNQTARSELNRIGG